MPRALRSPFLQATAVPTEKVVEPVAVAQDGERVVRARLPPPLHRLVTHVRGARRRGLHPTPVGVRMAALHVACVALAGVAQAAQVQPISLQRYCSDGDI